MSERFVFVCRCDKPGKYYYEATVTDEGLCRVGWSTLKATLDLGTDKEGFGFGGTGKKSFGRQFDTYGEVCLSLSRTQFLLSHRTVFFNRDSAELKGSASCIQGFCQIESRNGN